MRVAVIGMGNQGRKRAQVAAADLVATIDPIAPGAAHRTILGVPLDGYDAALVCTPDSAKPEILSYLLEHKKHVLVEKPLLNHSRDGLKALRQLAERNAVTCYTAYNHRFEPHIVRLKQTLESGVLGPVYQVKFFYGNGTARDVRNSVWRDAGIGVLSDLGSHLLDCTQYLFGRPGVAPTLWAAHRFENRAFDHCHFAIPGQPAFDYEMTMLSWRNTFRLDVYAENGSAHIDGLCKWGPSTFTLRRRVLPSGRPPEEAMTLVEPDPTWQAEYQHFRGLCGSPTNNLENDIWIDSVLNELTRQSTP
jgi:scyllo-inositol 2-dehydrogenase (NADP+)